MTPFGFAVLGITGLFAAFAPELEPSVRKPFEETNACVWVCAKYVNEKGRLAVVNPSSMVSGSSVPPVASTHPSLTSWQV